MTADRSALTRKFPFAATLFLLGIFAYLPTFFIPYVHGDEAGWATLARYVFTGHLYETVTDNKPPLLFEIHWLFTFGEHSWFFLRVMVALWSVLGSFVFFKILKKYFTEPGAMMGSALYILLLGLVENGAFSAERMYLPFLLIATHLALEIKEKTSFILRSFLIGICLGAAGSIKQPAFVLGLLPLWIMLTKQRRGSLVLAVTGSLLSILFFWVLIQAPFSDIYREVYLQNIQYVSHGGPLEDIGRNLSYIFLCYFSIIVGSVIALIYFFKQKRLPNSLVILWIVLSLIALCIGFRFYQTYYIALLPLLCCGTVFAFENSQIRILKTKIMTLAFLSVLGFHFFTYARQITNQNPAWNDQVRKTIAQIESDTRPEDKIWILNSVHALYASTQRTPAVKHIYFHQTLGHVDICQAPDLKLRENLNSENYRRLLSDLQQNQPAVIFWTKSHKNTCSDRLKMDQFPSLQNFIGTHYRLISDNSLGAYYRKLD